MLSGIKHKQFVTPHAGLALVEGEEHLWRAESDFPLFQLFEDTLLPTGSILISMQFQPHNDSYSPRICFDFGQGFVEHKAQIVPITKKGSVYYVLYLPPDLKRLAFSPVHKTGLFRLDIETVVVRPLNWLETHIHRTQRLWKFRNKPLYSQFKTSPKGRGYNLWDCLTSSRELYDVVSHFRAYRPVDAVSYDDWILANDSLDGVSREQICSDISTLRSRPFFSIIMPVFDPPPEYLHKAIQSVQNQLYPDWELCIADDASSDPQIRKILHDYQQQDSRIKVVFRQHNGHISRASNSALSLVEGAYIALLDHDDELHETALYYMGKEIVAHPEARFIYTDEDKIDKFGKRFEPHFKSDWNPELFYSINYVSHLSVLEKGLVDELGGFRPGFEGSQDYDLFLRAIAKLKTGQIRHIAKVLYHWRAIEGSTALVAKAKDYATEAGLGALKEFVAGTDWPCRVEEGLVPTTYRLVPSFTGEPSVTIIIPTRNGYSILKSCIESILQKTKYSNYDILIVDNQSDDPQTLKYLQRLENTKNNVNVLEYNAPFNYSKINNFAVERATGDLICLLNNDIEVITSGWLREMVFYAQQPEIGAVGAKLLYPDGTVQHGGVILGIGGVAGHAHKYLAADDPGYFCRAMLPQSFSAVTGACLLVEKGIFKQVDGLDEELVVAFNDVDLCLKFQESGFRNIWTPYAQLYHHESKTRGYEDTSEKKERFRREVLFMQNKWKYLLVNDAYYNKNLTKEREDFSLSSVR